MEGDKENQPLLNSKPAINNKIGTHYNSLLMTNNERAGLTSEVYCSHGNVCCQIQSPKYQASLVDEFHCHSGDDRDELAVARDKVARKRLIWASMICLLFMVVEIIGGFLANSLAIATDAAHLLTDFASFMISLFSIWYASRPATKRMSFGYYRAEVIGAQISVILIYVVTGILIYIAIQRLITGEYDIDATYMLITSAFGLVVNIIMGIALQAGGVPHGHSHGASDHADHSHSHSGEQAEGRRNINVRAAFIHVLGDFFQSLGVFVAALIIYFKPEWSVIDPICTFLFSILVLITTFNIIRDVFNVLMEGIPKGIDFLKVYKAMDSIPGVVKVHNLRIWSLNMDKVALSAHIVTGKNEDRTRILKKASDRLRSEFDIFELTLQVEEYREEMDDCSQCQVPN